MPGERVKARITGIGKYLPKKILSNKELESIVETSDEWIYSRTGMRERRIAAEGETTSSMGTAAAKKALAQASVEPESIDLILCATCTPDTLLSNTACLIQQELGALSAGAIDIQAACSGLLYGLSMAKAYIESGIYQRVLVVAPEKISSITNYKDRTTCVLFGDGAAACLVEGKGKGLLINDIELGADGNQAGLLTIPAGGSNQKASLETVSSDMHYIQMEGREVFKHAVRRMESAAQLCIKKAGLSENDITWLVPHQANIRIIEAMAKRFQVPMDRVYVTIHKYGNTSASSVGIALAELTDEAPYKEGEHILLVVFGAGFTWAAGILTPTNGE